MLTCSSSRSLRLADLPSRIDPNGPRIWLPSKRPSGAPRSVIRQPAVSLTKQGVAFRSRSSLHPNLPELRTTFCSARPTNRDTGLAASIRTKANAGTWDSWDSAVQQLTPSSQEPSKKANNTWDSWDSVVLKATAAFQEQSPFENGDQALSRPSNGIHANTMSSQLGTEYAPSTAPAKAKQLAKMPGSLPHFASAILLLYATNQGLGKLTAALGVKFPSALIGMFTIIALLLVLEKASSQKAEAVVRWFDPAILWLQRWLGAFYLPSLAILPLTIKGISGAALAKMFAVITVGMPLTLLSTAWVASGIRKLVKTEMLEVPLPPKLPPFRPSHFLSWGLVAVSSVALAAYNPAWASSMTFPCLLAATMGGQLLGSLLPPPLNKILHPVVVTCLVINGAAAAFGLVTGMGYEAVLQSYITKGVGQTGAGDFLMSFLGVIILSFAFKIYDQRQVMARHASEILGSCAASSVISMLGTAFMCRLAGLDPIYTLSLIPRSITMALALPIAAQLGASPGIVAAGVMITGLLGANFAQILLNLGRFQDPITRGLGTSSAAHGLGTAALASSEPEALPYCALAYALVGIISTFIIAVPGVPQLLLSIAG